MKIGLISDTHGHFEASILQYFDKCDEVWHLGDIGTVAVLDQLTAHFKVRSVFGNIDGHDIRVRSREFLAFQLSGKKFLLIHIAGKPPRYNPQVRKLIYQYRPDVLICGHSHMLSVQQDPQNQLLFINPGAAGKHGFHKKKTLIRFDLDQGRMSNMEVIELGNRASLS